MTNFTEGSLSTDRGFFFTHKKAFFDESKNCLGTQGLKGFAGEMNLGDLYNCQAELNQEFNDLSALLETKSVEENTEQFFYFSLYCSYLLANYHKACGNFELQQVYFDKAEQLVNKLDKVVNTNDEKQRQNFLDQLSQTFFDLWQELKSIFVQPSKYSQSVGMINLSRILLVMSRMSLTQLFIILEENNVLKKLSQLLQRDLTSAELIKRISILNGVFNVLSVAMFGSRLLRNLGATFYFIISPPEEAKKALPTKLNRLCHQLYQRKGELLNDSVWTVINGLTNYQLFGMSAATSMAITGGFMFFDLAVLLYLKQCDKQVFDKKQQQYDRERTALYEQLKGTLGEKEKASIIMRLEFLAKQERHGQISWRQTSAVYNFQIAAVLLLATSFSASLLVASPISVAFCFALSVFAVSMILSGKSYGNLQGLKAKRESADALGFDKNELDKECKKAQYNLGTDLVKNTLFPVLFVGTFAVCWEAGLVLTLGYLAYEGAGSYFQPQGDAPEPEVVPENGYTTSPAC